VLAAPFGVGASPCFLGERAARTDELSRAAAFALSPSLQDASHNQIEPRYKAAKRRRLQRGLAATFNPLLNQSSDCVHEFSGACRCLQECIGTKLLCRLFNAV
jgi:hypothetical protein